MFGKFEKRMSGTQMIALGFLLLIFIGTILLMLPVSSRNGEWTPFITALFTSTSATCVTGLVLVDTFTHWSIFGQLVLLVLIQIGGLGFITIGITVSLILRKKIGLKQRGLIKESLNTLEIGGVVRLVRRVIGGTFLFEMSGAFILTLRFLKKTWMFYVPSIMVSSIRFQLFVMQDLDLMGQVTVHFHPLPDSTMIL